MHAWLCDDPIGPDALKWTELPTPEPKPGQVRVAIRCASLNFPDLLIVQNKYQMKQAASAPRRSRSPRRGAPR